jgi:hypothetical protein
LYNDVINHLTVWNVCETIEGGWLQMMGLTTGFEYMLFVIGTGICVVWGVSAAVVALFRKRNGG